MAKLKEELIKATETLEVENFLNESMGVDDIAKELGTTKQNVYRALSIAMGKMYKQVKKEFKATPAQAVKMLMEFLNCDAEEILAYLDKNARQEIQDYVKQHGAD